MQTKGVGPVMAAALVAFIDIEKAPTVGHIWRFAGLDPSQKWESGQKRPWCATLKTVCWKMWQSWQKLKNDPEAEWARRMFERRAYEWANNLDGKLAGQAAAAALGKRWDKKSPTYAWLTGRVDPAWARGVVERGETFPLEPKLLPEGQTGRWMLPPGHIQSRAGRWTVKLWLSKWHEEAYKERFGKEPPLPYPIAQLGHAHKI